MINKNKYKIKDNSESFLVRNGFRYDKRMSDAEETFYYYRFTVYKYNISNIIEAEFLVSLDTKEIRVNVYETSHRGLYAPYYYYEYGNYDPIMDEINNVIDKEMKRLGIELCQ